MKKWFLIITLVQGMALYAFSQTDTIRVYNESTTTSTYYNTNTYVKQMARFDLEKPVIIKSIVVTLGGKKGGTLTMRVFGHSAGEMLASLFNDVTNPVTLTKTKDGTEKIVAEFDSPYVSFNNNQFFLLFENFNDARVISDKTDHPVSCQSGSGGTYYYQYVMNGSDNTWYLASNQNRAFAIDVLVDYPLPESRNIFSDFTTRASIDENISNSTIAAADYNDDGWIDLILKGNLYENQKNGTFKDVTTDKGLSSFTPSTVANVFVDMDNDADLDIILFGADSCVLFINDQNSFTAQGLNLPKFPAFLSFSFADINKDNYPDLFVSQLWKTYPEAEANHFFINDQNLGFIESTQTIYPKWDGTWNYPDLQWDPANFIIEKNRNSRGSQWVDFDNDGDPDLYVTNYFLQQDEFYQNNGDGTFTDICVAKGIDINTTGANHGTGVDWFDYDNDGNLDLLLPQFAHPRFIEPYDHRGTAIYHNEGAPGFTFTDMTGQYNNNKGLISPIGLELEETHAGGAWGDVNNDGLADILLTVFYGCRYIDFYEQQTDHSFQLKTFEYGLEGINTGTDLVWLDYDNDGRLDLAGAIGGKFRLFKNDVWNDKRWIEIELRSSSVNAYAIGGRAYVYANGKMYMQEVCAGRGQKMQKPYRLHFGLGYTPIVDSVVVLWPTSPQKKETFTNLQVDHIYRLTEGGSTTLSAKDTRQVPVVSLWPNPASGILNIGFSSTNIQPVTITLTGPDGKIVLSKTYYSTRGSNVVTIHVPKEISNGVYFLEVYSDDFRTVKRVFVTK